MCSGVFHVQILNTIESNNFIYCYNATKTYLLKKQSFLKDCV